MSLAVTFDTIPAKPVHWLHAGFVPFRHVTFVVAPGGTSKGLWTLEYAARMTRWAPMPGEAEPSYDGPMDVIVILPEDDPNEAVAGRLAGAHAATDRVHNLTVLPDGERFCIQKHMGKIGDAIAEISQLPRPADGRPRKVGMVILDPLLAMSENDLRTRGQARAVMEALETLAKKHHLAVFLTHHTNADGSAASSRALVETARNVITLSRVSKDPASPVRAMTVTKTNIGMQGLEERYILGGTLDEPSIAWACDMPATAVSVPQERGYEVAPAPGSGQYRALMQVPGDVPRILAERGTRALARQACEDHAGLALGWHAVPVEGMEGAETLDARYGVLDLAARKACAA